MGRSPIDLPGPLIRREEEKLVLLDRTANDPSELVLVQNLPRVVGNAVDRLGLTAEEIIGIESGISKELKRGAMELIGAGLGDHIHVGSRIPSVARIEHRSLNLEFLNRVGVYKAKARILSIDAQGSLSVVIRDGYSVHLNVILARAGSVYGNVGRSIPKRGRIEDASVGSGREAQKIRVVARGKRQDPLRPYCQLRLPPWRSMSALLPLRPRRSQLAFACPPARRDSTRWSPSRSLSRTEPPPY